MPIHKQVKSLFRNMFRKAQVEQDLDKELQIYFDMTAEEKVSRGMSVDEAQRAARMEMGGIEQVKEEVRAVRLGASIETLWQDIRFAIRMLLKTPGVTSAVAHNLYIVL